MSDSATVRSETAAMLWRRWVLATSLGIFVAFALFVAIFTIFGDPGDVFFPVLMVGVGLIVGLFQQRALRRSIPGVSWWAVATGAGFGVGMALAIALALGDGTGLRIEIIEGALAGASIGAILGTLQWLVLGHHVAGARWWVPVSIIGWAAGAAAGDAVGYFVEGLDILVAPIVAAAITGITLVALIGGRETANQDLAVQPGGLQDA